MTTTRANANGCRSPNVLGYSLPEALIAALVLAIVLLAIYMVYDTAQQDYARGTARADVQQNVRVALESMARELRVAGYNLSTTGCACSTTSCKTPPTDAVTGINDAPPGSVNVTFQADVDGDNCIDRVIYKFVPPADLTKPCDSSDPSTIGTVTRSVQAWNVTGTGPGTWPSPPTASDVAQCVTSLTMTYYDGSGATPTPAASVRRITIAIVGIENIRGFGARTYTLTSDVRLRNL